MEVGPFRYARIPPIYFGAGETSRLPALANGLGAGTVLLVTGARALEASGKLHDIRAAFERAGVTVHHAACPGEPTVSLVDGICADHRHRGIDVVVGIGGGSVVDAAKAISAMLPHGNSLFDHLEGVGRGLPHSGVKVPYIAVPTTSGTGSEVTKNAVISMVGPDGYKKSLRHDALVPDAVVVDGGLLVGCPSDVTAACGMDAFTQLLEPFLAPGVSAMTEALAWSGLQAIKDNLPAACGAGAGDIAVRQGMAYAALMSGIALANDGLGIVHGLAGPVGGFFPIPHGVACATLVAPALRANLKALQARDPDGPALVKLARVGQLFDGKAHKTPAYHWQALLDTLDEWTAAFDVPRLGRYGVGEADLDKILDQAANRNNPVELTRDEIREMLLERL